MSGDTQTLVSHLHFLLIRPFCPYRPSHPSDLHILFLLFTFHPTVVDRPPIPSVPSALSFIVVNRHGLCRTYAFYFPFSIHCDAPFI